MRHLKLQPRIEIFNFQFSIHSESGPSEPAFPLEEPCRFLTIRFSHTLSPPAAFWRKTLLSKTGADGSRGPFRLQFFFWDWSSMDGAICFGRIGGGCLPFPAS